MRDDPVDEFPSALSAVDEIDVAEITDEVDLTPDEEIEEVAIPARVIRLSFVEARRAARRARAEAASALWLPRLPTGREYLREVTAGRLTVWTRIAAAREANARGDMEAARTALHDALLTEDGIEALVGAVAVPRTWWTLRTELRESSAEIIAGCRDALAALESGSSRAEAALAVAQGAQSRWLRVWRTFIHIAPAG
jgi:hypothetical protein